MKPENEPKTIRYQILRSFSILTGVIILLVGISFLFFRLSTNNYDKAISFQRQQYAAQQVISAHYQWLEQLSDSITTGNKFEGSLDPSSCALGQWLSSSAKDLERYPLLSSALSGIITPHEEIHTQAAELLSLAESNRDAAYEKYAVDFKPKVLIIGEGLHKISGIYEDMSDALISSTRRTVLFSVALLSIIGICSVIFSLLLGKRMSLSISRPILAVEKWSRQLSTGVENLHFDSAELQNSNNALEIAAMIDSFQKMADNIKNHVQVIQKVADGDLTAYVDIRSDGDSLGKALYHMVQNNDHMFTGLLQISDAVATSADQIASSSQVLADNSTTQAGAVEQLSSTVHQARELAGENAASADGVAGMISGMNHEVKEGQQKMKDLFQAVQEIEKASEGISAVMKSINDIAFQTNILALNAAVEAARAGNAGKGFAVVADEVRNLALKSQEAAERSRLLIEDTILKASEGGKISGQAFEIFQGIVEWVSQVEVKILSIDDASSRQQELIQQINDEIDRISNAITQNAATSEENAASTEQMSASAAQIKLAMKHFNLRKRVMGKPYIPPEKSNDSKFIEEATQNYNLAKQSGKFV